MPKWGYVMNFIQCADTRTYTWEQEVVKGGQGGPLPMRFQHAHLWCASVVLDGVLGPLRLARHIWRCPSISGVPGSNALVESKQRSETGKGELLGGTEEKSICPMRGLEGKSMIFYFSGPPNNYLIICDLPVWDRYSICGLQPHIKHMRPLPSRTPWILGVQFQYIALVLVFIQGGNHVVRCAHFFLPSLTPPPPCTQNNASVTE